MSNQPTIAANAAQQSKQTPNLAADTSIHTMTIHCTIRRKPSLIGLPGTDPNERVYKIGAALDSVTRKNLKGISDALELKYMPGIIGTNTTDNNFQDKINEYWGNIGVFVPADDNSMKPEERGKVLRIVLNVQGAKLKKAIEDKVDLKDKINLIQDQMIKGTINIADQYVPDFIFLCYCLKYPRVARDVSMVNNSPKIHFYIYNKNSAVKTQLSLIELRNKAVSFFAELQDNEQKVNYLLVMFEDMPSNYDTLEDKIIALDEHYNRDKSTLQKFVDFMSDDELETKYLIKYATSRGKLKQLSNSQAYYYNDTLIGSDLDEAVLFLNNKENAEAKAIRATLEQEIKM